MDQAGAPLKPPQFLQQPERVAAVWEEGERRKEDATKQEGESGVEFLPNSGT